jgi:hypothetical protein
MEKMIGSLCIISFGMESFDVKRLYDSSFIDIEAFKI